jgi:hypothetical protein
MTELNTEHQQLADTWSESIRQRFLGAIATHALRLAEWVGERTEYQDTSEDIQVK